MIEAIRLDRGDQAWAPPAEVPGIPQTSRPLDPRRKLQPARDHEAAHKTTKVRDRLEENPRIRVHFNTKIRPLITGWNKRSRPFVWTKTADEILTKTRRKILQERAPSHLAASG